MQTTIFRHFLGLTLAVTVFVIGCRDQSNGPTPAHVSTICEFDGSDRWGPSGKRYRLTTALGSGSDVWFINIMGIHASEDDVYIFDAGEPAVLHLGPGLEFRRRFGRRGDGPGEFREAHRHTSVEGGSPRFIAGYGSTVAVFDHTRVSLFDRDGSFKRVILSVSPEREFSFHSARIALVGEGLLYGSGGYDAFLRHIVGLETPAYSVKYWNSGQVSNIVRLVLATSPVGADGVPFRGPNQARPMWDASGGCVVASDGENPWLVVSSIAAERVDTIALPLPDRDPPRVNPQDLAELMPSTGARSFPEPTAMRRIDDLVIDPDGNVWVLPLQTKRANEDGVEVIRVSLATGQATVDTVPRFPREFGAPGVYYATTKDELDRVIVERYELGGTGGKVLVVAESEKPRTLTAQASMLNGVEFFVAMPGQVVQVQDDTQSRLKIIGLPDIQALIDSYQIPALPYWLSIDKNGVVANVHVGLTPDFSIETFLQ